MRTPFIWILLSLFLAVAPQASSAACSATISNINFGSVSVRTGVVNQTSGTVTVNCSGILNVAVGICLRFGPGSGGAGAGNSPRYMRRSDNAALEYQLRAGGNGSGFGTLNTMFLSIPLSLGSGSASTTIYADITSNSVAVGTGAYASVFSGTANVSLEYGLLGCQLLGTPGTVTAFTVSAEVVPSCELSVGAMNFGVISNVITSPVDQTATINVRCTANTSYSVKLDMGQGAGVTDPANRLMTNGASTLRYGLYQDGARSVAWGNLAGNDVDSSGTGSDNAFTVYGRIHAGQTAVLGTYTDNVVVTVNY